MLGRRWGAVGNQVISDSFTKVARCPGTVILDSLEGLNRQQRHLANVENHATLLNLIY